MNRCKFRCDFFCIKKMTAVANCYFLMICLHWRSLCVFSNVLVICESIVYRFGRASNVGARPAFVSLIFLSVWKLESIEENHIRIRNRRLLHLFSGNKLTICGRGIGFDICRNILCDIFIIC